MTGLEYKDLARLVLGPEGSYVDLRVYCFLLGSICDLCMGSMCDLCVCFVYDLCIRVYTSFGALAGLEYKELARLVLGPEGSYVDLATISHSTVL